MAISYYLFNIVAKFAGGATEHFLGPSTKFPDWVLVPVILLLVWWAIRRLRHRIKKSTPVI